MKLGQMFILIFEDDRFFEGNNEFHFIMVTVDRGVARANIVDVAGVDRNTAYTTPSAGSLWVPSAITDLRSVDVSCGCCFTQRLSQVAVRNCR